MPRIKLHLPPRSFVLEGMSTFWGGPLWGTTHPPNPPSSAPTQTKRVPICSFLDSASICILIKSWIWIVAELWGKNWDADAHALMTYQAPTTGLHSPTLLPLLRNSTDYLTLAQSWKFGVICCSIGLTHPAACTRTRVHLTVGHVHSPPLLPNLLKKGGNQLGLSWGFWWYIYIFVGLTQNKTGEPPQKPKTSPGDHPPFDPYTYQSIVLNVRIPIYNVVYRKVDIPSKNYSFWGLLSRPIFNGISLLGRPSSHPAQHWLRYKSRVPH